LIEPIIDRLGSFELALRFTEPEDAFDAILEINAGAGGVEAMDWCKILFRMYSRWADSHGFKVELLDVTSGEVAGFKSIAIEIVGANVFGLLKHENGVHRLVRMSPFDAAGKRHTSFCSVSVVPDFPENDETIVIKKEDYTRDVFRCGGPGGQAVNKIESGVRLTHLKTGLIAKSTAERSQHENFRIAFQRLKGLLFDLNQKNRDNDFQEKYQNQKNSVAFGHQIRSYVLAPKQFVTDDRTDKQYFNVNEILDGKLDELL
jgi:peptide chain release factor 2